MSDDCGCKACVNRRMGRTAAPNRECKTCANDRVELRDGPTADYPGYACGAGVLVNRDGRDGFSCNRYEQNEREEVPEAAPPRPTTR